jgi:hypothetical protein
MWCDLRARYVKCEGVYFEGDKFSPETVWSHGAWNGWLRGAIGKEQTNLTFAWRGGVNSWRLALTVAGVLCTAKPSWFRVAILRRQLQEI